MDINPYVLALFGLLAIATLYLVELDLRRQK